ncbi:leukocyte elastase inhibitor-like [Paroedura picta]|uniref:leukocyte elastase inhibitor-like n=1 Tax=Paroedura picta TaxID=143630 RepID=UPI004056FBDE
MTSFSAANANFGLDLFKEMIQQKARENIFFSPLSLQTALAMLMLGAKGDTEVQMEKVLHFNEIKASGYGQSSETRPFPAHSEKQPGVTRLQCEKPKDVHFQFQALLSRISKPTKDYELNIANRLYGAMEFEFIPQYVRSTKELYHSELERVDFLNAAEEARQTINSWVQCQTNGKIQDFFPAGALDPSTVLVLVNAIYFKGKWLSKFKEKFTTELPFWVTKVKSKNVPMMFQHGTFKWARIQDSPFQVLELLYEGEELSMLLMLPDDGASLDQLTRSLSYEKIEEWTSPSNMCTIEVDLFLPKFKLEGTYKLNEYLQSMGMTDAFMDGKADFTEMSGKMGLHVSDITQKCLMEVNEEGTEAAASSGVQVVPMCAQFPLEFKVNRPFVFLIRDNIPPKSILFCGKYSSP